MSLVLDIALFSIGDTLATLVLPGVLCVVVGLVYIGIAKRAAAKLRRLKQTGDSYEADEIALIPRRYVNATMGFRPSVYYAECFYHDSNNQRCKAKSPMFLWNRWEYDKEYLRAVVYVDKGNPRRYAVEVTYHEPTGDTPPA